MSGYRSRGAGGPVPHHTVRSTGPGPVLMYIGNFALTPVRAVVILAFVGSSAFILWAVIKVRDSTQIPMLSSGFLILGIACAAIAIGALIELWRAAIRARLGRAVGMAIGGGFFGLAAIGCFTLTVIFALLQKS
jgi:hypothetical protein